MKEIKFVESVSTNRTRSSPRTEHARSPARPKRKFLDDRRQGRKMWNFLL